MSTVRFQFSTGRSLTSRVIRTVSHSEISHVDLVLSDGWLIGAQSSRYGSIPAGVYRRPPNYERFSRRIIASIETTLEVAGAVEAYFVSQLGKPYDWRGVFGFVIGFEANRDWRDPSAWYCDELAARALEVAKFWSRPLVLAADHMTPGDLLLVLSPVATVEEL